MYIIYTYVHVCLFSMPTELPRRESVIDQIKHSLQPSQNSEPRFVSCADASYQILINVLNSHSYIVFQRNFIFQEWTLHCRTHLLTFQL